jgi:hypothetical protein
MHTSDHLLPATHRTFYINLHGTDVQALALFVWFDEKSISVDLRLYQPHSMTLQDLQRATDIISQAKEKCPALDQFSTAHPADHLQDVFHALGITRGYQEPLANLITKAAKRIEEARCS